MQPQGFDESQFALMSFTTELILIQTKVNTHVHFPIRYPRLVRGTEMHMDFYFIAFNTAIEYKYFFSETPKIIINSYWKL